MYGNLGSERGEKITRPDKPREENRDLEKGPGDYGGLGDSPLKNSRERGLVREGQRLSEGGRTAGKPRFG